MTGVYFNGRLGNQLFQFTFFLYLRSRSKGSLVFFPNPHHAYLDRYFELDPYTWYLGRKWKSAVWRLTNRLLSFRNVYVHNFSRPRPRDADNGVMYHGFFQTDWYLEQLPEKPVFKIRKKYRQAFDEQYGGLFRDNKTVVVHIRRTDYLSYGKRDISLPIDYFKRRLQEIEDIDACKVIFLSDDMDYVKHQIPLQANYLFLHNNEIIDFQLIQHADVAIISNSSFSWWASYLGKKGSVVYAPKNWLGFHIGAEHPKGIMTPKFLWRS